MVCTSNEQRARWPGGGLEAMKALLGTGYRSNKYRTWEAPEGHTPTPRELDAIGYLMHEWNWGTLVNGTPEQLDVIWDSYWKEPGK